MILERSRIPIGNEGRREIFSNIIDKLMQAASEAGVPNPYLQYMPSRSVSLETSSTSHSGYPIASTIRMDHKTAMHLLSLQD